MKIFVEPKERLITLSQEEFELYNFLDKNKNLIGIKCTNENINFKNNQILNIP